MGSEPRNDPTHDRDTDFVGPNHDTNSLVQHDPAAPYHDMQLIQVEPAPTTFGWPDTPEALRELLRVAREFTDLPIYVAVNGASFGDSPTQRRIPRQSAYWYRDLIRQHTTGRNP